MATPHISAEPGEVARTVLMPGDPLRAKFIAERYLERPVCFNEVRGMLGYTGGYHGAQVSVMGSGMGMPSMGIYAYELFALYGVERIIRIGSAGAYAPELALFDLLLATGAYSESSFARVQNGFEGDERLPDAGLCDALRASAGRLGLPLCEGKVHSSDVFYRLGEAKPGEAAYWETLRDARGCQAVEMESFALFQCAAATGKAAACLLTISDSFVCSEAADSAQREQSFTAMMEVALGAVQATEDAGRAAAQMWQQ